MQHAIERRQAGAARMAFDEKVDVGGEHLPPFEANAVDVSRDGLHLTSPYLPELGQPLSCRFSVGESEVICEGTVVWRQESAGEGGHEFGLRFTALDSESARTLSELMMCQPSMSMPAAESLPPETRVSANEDEGPSPRGARIRLHIEGLGAPMRARVRDADQKTVSAQSELGFLQLGKELELEDATTGQKRSARIDQVEVELDPTTQVPQLVVGLAYLSQPIRPVVADADLAPAPDTDPEQPSVRREVVRATMQRETVPAHASIAPMAIENELIVDPEIAEESARMKGPIAGAFQKITPAVVASSQKVYAAMRTLWAKRRASSTDAPVRRTTALPPGGGVTSKTRRATRGPNSVTTGTDPIVDATPKDKALSFAKTHKRKLAAGGALTAAALLVGLALGQPSEDKPLASLPQPAEAPVAAAAAAPPAPTPAPAPAPIAAPQPQAMNPADLPVESGSMADGAEDDLASGDRVAASPRSKRVARPFGRGKIEHGKAFRMKMDGPIEDIQGAQLPEGFLVTLPQRRSLEGAATLFKQDPRVLHAKVDNTSHGAELELTFKDGTPSYVVRARGETLEIVLSNPSGRDDDKSSAKNDKSDRSDKKKGADKNEKTAHADGKKGDKSSDKRDAKKKDKGGIERASLKSGRNRSR